MWFRLHHSASRRKVLGSISIGGEDAIQVFYIIIKECERRLREDLRAKQPLTMLREDWQAYSKVRDCHICEKLLVRQNVKDAMDITTKTRVHTQEDERLYQVAVQALLPRRTRRVPAKAVSRPAKQVPAKAKSRRKR